MNDIRQTAKYAKYLKKIGWQVERIGEINYFIKKFPLIGSVIKIQRPENISIKKIQNLAKKHHAFQIIIEPKTQLDADFLENVGFRLSRNPYLPTKTLHLDLTKTQDELFSQLKKDVKYSFRKTEKLKIEEVKKVNEIGDFKKAWKRAVGLKRYVPPVSQLKMLKKIFNEDALFLKTKDCSASAIFLLGDNIAYYWQAFSDKKARKELFQYKIVWKGILWAKSRGAKVFDFEGIYDSRFPNKSWEGFTHFKRSFGGHEVKYPGAFIKWRMPIFR